MLGGLPLAIELVAAYSAVQNLDLSAIVHELETDKLQAPSLTFDASSALISRFGRSWKVLSVKQQQLFAGMSLLNAGIFPRAGAVALAVVVNSNSYGSGGSYREIDAITKAQRAADERQAQLCVSTLVSYALVEPTAGESLRLHPLLREYATDRLVSVPAQLTWALSAAAKDFWSHYSPNAASMDNMLKRLQQEFETGDTTTKMPTLSKLIDATWKTSIHARWHDEPHLARQRVLDVLWIANDMGDMERAGECHQLLGWLEEDAGNKRAAILAYKSAARCFEQTKSHHLFEVHNDLRRLGAMDG
jgi:hypothetical protein